MNVSYKKDNQLQIAIINLCVVWNNTKYSRQDSELTNIANTISSLTKKITSLNFPNPNLTPAQKAAHYRKIILAALLSFINRLGISHPFSSLIIKELGLNLQDLDNNVLLSLNDSLRMVRELLANNDTNNATFKTLLALNTQEDKKLFLSRLDKIIFYLPSNTENLLPSEDVTNSKSEFAYLEAAYQSIRQTKSRAPKDQQNSISIIEETTSAQNLLESVSQEELITAISPGLFQAKLEEESNLALIPVSKTDIAIMHNTGFLTPVIADIVQDMGANYLSWEKLQEIEYEMRQKSKGAEVGAVNITVTVQNICIFQYGCSNPNSSSPEQGGHELLLEEQKLDGNPSLSVDQTGIANTSPSSSKNEEEFLEDIGSINNSTSGEIDYIALAHQEKDASWLELFEKKYLEIYDKEEKNSWSRSLGKWLIHTKADSVIYVLITNGGLTPQAIFNHLVEYGGGEKLYKSITYRALSYAMSTLIIQRLSSPGNERANSEPESMVVQKPPKPTSSYASNPHLKYAPKKQQDTKQQNRNIVATAMPYRGI